MRSGAYGVGRYGIDFKAQAEQLQGVLEAFQFRGVLEVNQAACCRRRDPQLFCQVSAGHVASKHHVPQQPFCHGEPVTESTSNGVKALPLAFDALVQPYRWFTL